MRKVLIALAALGFGFAGADGAVAATANCATSQFTTSLDCDDNFSTDGTVGTDGGGGNVILADMNAPNGPNDLGVFDKTWIQLDRADDFEDSGTGANGLFTFGPSGNDVTSGTWTLAPNLTFVDGHHYAFALKGGPRAAVYLVDNAFTSGDWNTDGILGAGLSNVTLFGTSDLGVVPLPAAGWLLISGVAGLGLLGRRKRAA